MACDLRAICFLGLDPARLARFWSALLGWEPEDDVTLLPGDGNRYRLRFVATEEPKRTQNRAHFDLTSASLDDQRRLVARALELGGRHVDVGQDPDDPHVVLGDPEGNELCVIEPGNRFLAGCGRVGALACDGSEAVGRFWSTALGWPLVWDQDEETAIQAPHGGTKITWGGPPLMPRVRLDRVRFELAAEDVAAEADRLVALGATVVADGVLADPDGTVFTVVGS